MEYKIRLVGIRGSYYLTVFKSSRSDVVSVSATGIVEIGQTIDHILTRSETEIDLQIQEPGLLGIPWLTLPILIGLIAVGCIAAYLTQTKVSFFRRIKCHKISWSYIICEITHQVELFLCIHQPSAPARLLLRLFLRKNDSCGFALNPASDK